MTNQQWKRLGLWAVDAIIVILPAYFLFRYVIFPEPVVDTDEKAVFVGRESCAECHQNECRLYEGSHHDLAMDRATDSTVLGNFDHAEYEWNGVVSKFYKRDGKFFVHTAGEGGKMGEYEITYVFGVTPLQQYLIPFEGGRYQCLPLAWDSEKNKWFHLVPAMYPGQDIQPDNWLYWTNQGQNWNSMCADCHSTDLRKGYDMASGTYHTTWSEIDVSCEACHGPASRHLEWARLPEGSRPMDGQYGLEFATSNVTSQQMVDMCARCHARRSAIKDYDVNADDMYLMNHMLPSLLRRDLYYPDGQVMDEDYIYGSFVQSKMYKNNVKCTDCHDVHSAKKKYEGNRLCTQCHRAALYDTPEHHHHKYSGAGQAVTSKNGRRWEVGSGAECINCHEVGTYYMGNDYRHDHSFRIPRPDLTIATGSPNACTYCHATETPQWAEAHVTKWYGKRYRPHFGTVFYAAQRMYQGADEGLVELIEDDLVPVLVRATAIELLAPYISPTRDSLLMISLQHHDPLIRHTALTVFPGNSVDAYLKHVIPMLYDPIKAVRTQAARTLTQMPANHIPASDKKAFEKTLDEYVKIQEYLGDFPSSRYNLGNMYANQGKPDEAIEQYTAAIRIDDRFFPAMVNLATLYNGLQQNDKAEMLLKRVIEINPEQWDSYYSLGLLEAEMQRYDEAVKYLSIAQERLPHNPRISYNLGLLLDQLQRDAEAEKTLQRAVSAQPDNIDFQKAIISFYLKRNNYAAALRHTKELLKHHPNDEESNQLLKTLEK